MGGNKQFYKVNPKKENEKLMEEQKKALEIKQQKKAKYMLVLKICVAVFVLAAAVVLCLFMLKHDFNPGREQFLGTYIAENRYVYATVSGSELSNARETFAVTFYEDGRMIFKKEAGNTVYYFDYEESATDIYDGVIVQHLEGKVNNRISITREDDGDMVMYYTDDSVSFTVPALTRCFGEELTLNMLKGLYTDEVSALLMAGDYDSITDDQLKGMNVERDQLEDIAFAIKDIPVVITLSKISDENLSRKKALEMWEAGNEVSLTDAPNEDKISDSDADIDDGESDA